MIAFGILLSAASAENAEPKNLRVKQNQNQASAQQQLTKTENSMAKDLPSLAQTAKAIDRDTVTAYRQYEADQNSYSAPAVRVQIFLAVVGLLYVGTALLQWRALREQTAQTERALIANIRPRISIVVLADKTRWLGHPNMHLNIPFQTKNSGPSPAFVKVYNEMVYITDKRLPEPPLYGENLPCPEIPAHDLRECIVASRPVSPDEQSLLNQRRLNLYLIVRVIYDDEMGNEHETAMCALHEHTTGRFLRPDDCPSSYFKNT